MQERREREDAEHPLVVGDLAHGCQPLGEHVTCEEVDRVFRADPALSSVVIEAGDEPVLVNRRDFYQGLTGRLGYGWALHHRRSVLGLGLAATRSFPASRRAGDAAMELLVHPDVDGASDVLVRYDDGSVGVLGVASLLAELADTHQRQAIALAASARWFEALVANSNEVTLVLDIDGTVRYASPSRSVPDDLAREERVGRLAFADVHPDDLDLVRGALARLLADPSSEQTVHFRRQAADGSWRWAEANGRNLCHDPVVNGVVVNSRDIHDRHVLEDQLRHQALHDQLTGLANRTLLADRTAHALERLDRAGGALALVFCDLDGFKTINDSYGHDVGDELLVAVARRLAGCLRGGDTLARLGGDEFAVLAEELVVAEDADALAARLVEAVRDPFDVAGRQLRVSASVGVAATHDADLPPEELLRRSDLAMYGAKLAGKDRSGPWSPEIQARVLGADEEAEELRAAIERHELVLHYQPIVDLPGARIVGAEALVRWQHPIKGLLVPGQFIATAERTGLIVPLGRYVLDAACRQLATWRDQGDVDESFVLNVNLSAVQLAREDLLDDVRHVLEASGVPAASLQLEVTETALVTNSATVEANFASLRQLGVQVAIDDFGTGYASLSYLQRFPITTLKVDRSFVERLGRSPDDYLIVESVIRLAHSLGVTVTAEGIEAADQLAALIELACDRAQGFLFAEPIEANTFSDSLRARRFAGSASLDKVSSR